MAPHGPAYDADWIVSNTSNVHLASHRDWFTTFTEIRTKIAQFPWGPATVDVHGFGTVVLETRVHDSGRHKPSRKITLKNVFYVPASQYNIFASSVSRKDYTVDHSIGRMSTKDPIKEVATGRLAGLIVHGRLSRIWLKGQRETQSSLEPGKLLYIHAFWPAEEVAKLQAPSRAKGTERSGIAITYTDDAASDMAIPPLTEGERKWLKDSSYKSEFKFLRSFGLNITNDEERAEGRRILETFMAKDACDSDDAEASESDFEAELESDPTSHVADYQFSDAELDWIKKHYRHSGNFLLSHGLKPFDDEDCKDGVRIVRAFMGHDR